MAIMKRALLTVLNTVNDQSHQIKPRSGGIEFAD
jgi:hypothetical protein